MAIYDEQQLMALVVDKQTRRVIDCVSVSYSWDFDRVFDRHDFAKVEVIIRQCSSTKPKVVEEPAPEPEPAPEAPDAGEEVQF